MSFFKELFARFLNLFKPDKSHIVDRVQVGGEITSLLAQAKFMAASVNIPEKVIIHMFGDDPYKAVIPESFVIINMGMHSSEKRLYLFNMPTACVERMHVAHGKHSDKGPGNSGWATKFSNIPESNMTSLGLYKCAEEYKSAKFGKALRLDGLESTNSNARKRAIVLHGSTYCDEVFVKKNGAAGRSLGCPAVSYQYANMLIDELKNKGLLFIYKEGENI